MGFMMRHFVWHSRQITKKNRNVLFDIYFQENNIEVMKMQIKDTVNLMLSDSYKDRFRAEYFQTKERYQRLHLMIVKNEVGVLDFQPDCPLDLLKRQAKAMGEYLYVLEMRAHLEKIDLE